MKKYNSILKYIFVVITALFITGCVHDDKYDAPNLDDYQCRNADYYVTGKGKELTKMTLTALKAKAQNVTLTDKAYIEGYVSSTDETGNIYKTIYIQDDPTNPTEGLTISVDAVSTYTKFPQGSKVYIDIEGLALSSYGGVTQLGMITDAGTRIPEKYIPAHIYRDCSVKATIVPKVMTFAQMVAANDKYIGCLIQVNNAEFDSKVLCMNYAPDATTVDRVIRDNSTTTTRIVRNSGYASFANQIMPSGNGKFVGIYSKFNSTYQLYINRVSDLEMNKFPRLDGIAADPCKFSDTGLTQKTIADVKKLYISGNWNQITGDFYVKAQVTANDETGNLYKYVYIEDATGGLRFNINKTNLYQDNRFRVGKDIYIKLKDLYVSNVNGEIQLGGLFNGGNSFGGIEEVSIYKSVFDGNAPIRDVLPTERTISQLTTADVGRWIKLKGVQFIDADLYKPYASGASATNRTLTDCTGKTIILRTSNFATFAGKDVSGGKGDVYAILSAFNGTYQLWIPYQINANLNNPRCDGSTYVPLSTIYGDDFSSGLANWTTVNVTGAEVWTISNQGNSGNNYAIMNGFASGNKVNEDWLISKEVSLVGKTKAVVSFTTDVRYAGNPLQVYATDNYTGTPSTTTWTLLPATLDTNTAAFGDWASSGNVDLSAFLGKNVRIAFKYTSTTSAAATWEVDDFKIKGL